MGGSGQISERIAEQLRGSVMLNQPVVRVSQNAEGVSVETLTGDKYKVCSHSRYC